VTVVSAEDINNIGNYIVLVAIVPFGLFTVLYGILSPWYRSLLGLTMFMLGLSLTSVLGVVLLRRWFGTYPGYEWVAVIVYSIATCTAFGLVVIYLVERSRRPMLELTLRAKKDE
jgi:flagellar biosynthesis protein FlhB